MDLRNGNCLELMKTLPDKSIDLFICDLPYGETNCKWDSKIDMEEFWLEFKRLRKSKRTACIHFCSTKFGYTLIKSNEKMFKMDMVWKKRNKTGGLQSRHRPMRNHEMVYFFYEQAPKYNRDKYHKRIQSHKEPYVKSDEVGIGKTKKAEMNAKHFDPPNPASVLEEVDQLGMKKKYKGIPNQFEPSNPVSVVEEKKSIYGCNPEARHGKKAFDPPNPASVVEEADANKATIYKGRKKGNKDPLGMDAEFKKIPFKHLFDPPNPASVVEEKPKKKLRDKTNSTRAKEGKDIFGNNDTNVKPFNFEPPNPASVVEELDQVYGKACKGKGANSKEYRDSMKAKGLELYYDPPNPASVVLEDEPKSMFESTKVFIGKRNHQTEKPQDILEFFLKYWSDEGDTILDPTMGSGSTGVACKKLNRKFIGFELDETIFKVAEKRCTID